MSLGGGVLAAQTKLQFQLCAGANMLRRQRQLDLGGLWHFVSNQLFIHPSPLFLMSADTCGGSYGLLRTSFLHMSK